jgi:CheY-like chemotaxis protein
MAEASILLVDDDEAFCTIMRELLVRHGFRVRVAGAAEQALQLLRQERPDIILTDIMMPEVDGLTLIRRIRSNPAGAAIPTVVVSALVLARERAAAAQAGADAFLAKPFSFSQLRTTIQDVLAVG